VDRGNPLVTDLIPRLVHEDTQKLDEQTVYLLNESLHQFLTVEYVLNDVLPYGFRIEFQNTGRRKACLLKVNVNFNIHNAIFNSIGTLNFTVPVFIYLTDSGIYYHINHELYSILHVFCFRHTNNQNEYYIIITQNKLISVEQRSPNSRTIFSNPLFCYNYLYYNHFYNSNINDITLYDVQGNIVPNNEKWSYYLNSKRARITIQVYYTSNPIQTISPIQSTLISNPTQSDIVIQSIDNINFSTIVDLSVNGSMNVKYVLGNILNWAYIFYFNYNRNENRIINKGFSISLGDYYVANYSAHIFLAGIMLSGNHYIAEHVDNRNAITLKPQFNLIQFVGTGHTVSFPFYGSSFWIYRSYKSLGIRSVFFDYYQGYMSYGTNMPPITYNQATHVALSNKYKENAIMSLYDDMYYNNTNISLTSPSSGFTYLPNTPVLPYIYDSDFTIELPNLACILPNAITIGLFGYDFNFMTFFTKSNLSTLHHTVHSSFYYK
jgi:hypothetical protein